MRAFADHGNAERIDLLADCLRNLICHPFLDLETPCKHIHKPRNLAESDHALAREVRDVTLAEKRQQVMLAQRVEVDVLDDHHFVIIDSEESVIENLINV